MRVILIFLLAAAALSVAHPVALTNLDAADDGDEDSNLANNNDILEGISSRQDKEGVLRPRPNQLLDIPIDVGVVNTFDNTVTMDAVVSGYDGCGYVRDEVNFRCGKVPVFRDEGKVRVSCLNENIRIADACVAAVDNGDATFRYTFKFEF
ncbi:hypothetical protein BC829DRAFT_402495 [Chytridium lagenaria]|nr:hypothetical protein BC829DRAFT_402495 [Chytridium lagenaria]